jgi:hypothetical protein
MAALVFTLVLTGIAYLCAVLGNAAGERWWGWSHKNHE